MAGLDVLFEKGCVPTRKNICFYAVPLPEILVRVFVTRGAIDRVGAHKSTVNRSSCGVVGGTCPVAYFTSFRAFQAFCFVFASLLRPCCVAADFRAQS